MTEPQKIVIPPRSLYRDLIETALSRLEVDQMTTWDALEAATGKPRVELYAAAGSARNALRRKSHMHFIVVTGEGIQRISHKQAAREQVPAGTRQVRAKAGKVVRLTEALDLTQMEQSDRLSVVAHQSMAKHVRHVTSEKTVKRLESAQSRKPLEPWEVMGHLMAMDGK